MTDDVTTSKLISAFILFTCLLITLPGTASSDNLLFVADEWCPYNCAPGTKTPGYIVEIARHAFAAEGHTINYVVVPWARAIEGTRNGTYDAIIAAGREEAPDFTFPAQEIGIASHRFFVSNESNWEFTDLDSLHEVTLGVIKDYSYGTLFKDYIEPNESHPTRLSIVSGDDSLSRNIQMLMMGRIDVMVEDQNVMGYHFSRNDGRKLIKEVGTVCNEKLYIAFSPANSKSDQYSTILNNAVQKLRDSGELAEILKKYGVEEW